VISRAGRKRNTVGWRLWNDAESLLSQQCSLSLPSSDHASSLKKTMLARGMEMKKEKSKESDDSSLSRTFSFLISILDRVDGKGEC
jgi:hypothetical protein